MPVDKHLAQCGCGKTALEIIGNPIYCTICHCDDCQAAAEELGEAPLGEPIMDAFRGTAYVLHRKDRYAIIRGKDHLQPFKLRKDSPTTRMIAGCCNAPLFLSFDNSQHWISIYLARFGTHAPSADSRIATKFIDETIGLPEHPPTYKTFPLKMMAVILKSRVLMAIGR